MVTSSQTAHHNMVDRQVRPWDVVDERVLDTLAAVRRSDFVPEAWRNLAYADLAIPLDCGEVMMKPVVEGRTLQSLQLTAEDRVLEIGTGSGYFSACLARLAGSVVSIELHRELADAASERLHRAAANTVDIEVADAVHEYQANRPFDAIVATGAVAELPTRWLEWLAPGGRLFAICGESPAMQARLFRRGEDGKFASTSLFETDLPHLRHAEPERRFAF